MNKKTSIPILILALVLLLSTIAYAAPVTDALQGGLSSINNFLSNQYAPYSKALDFFFFSLLFIAVYMMGARYAFKEMKRPEQVIVILLGLATAFLLVLRDISITSLLPWIHWILYVLLFMLYWWMLKGIESKFWRFITALLLTILTIMLMQGLFDYFSAPKVPTIGTPSLPKTSFFKNFGLNFKPTLSNPLSNFNFGLKKDTTGENVIIDTVTPPDPTKPEPGTGGTTPPPEKKNKWLWLLLLLLIPLIWWLLNRWRKRDKGTPDEQGATTPQTGPVPLTIKILIDEINRIIALKAEILKKIRAILEAKENLSGDFLKDYHETINDRAFLMDKESNDYKTLMQRNTEAAKLINLEIELEMNLLKLREIEEELTTGSVAIFKIDLSKLEEKAKELKKDESGKEELKKVLIQIKETEEKIKLYKSGKGRIVEWSEFIKTRYAGQRITLESSARWYQETLAKISSTLASLMDGDKGLLMDIKRIIAQFFLIAEKEEAVEKQLKELTDLGKLSNWLGDNKYGRWKLIQEKTADQLIDHFHQQEKPYFNTKLMPAVYWQMKYLRYIRYLLYFLEKDKMFFVDFKDMKVELNNPANEKWDDVTSQATAPPGILPGDLRISAEIEIKVQNEDAEIQKDNAEKYNAVCYLDGVKRATKPVGKDSIIQFTSEELGGQFAPGRHTVTIDVMHSNEEVYHGRGTKSISIYIRGTEQKKILILAPLNSTPEKPIYLFSHTAGKNKLVINKERNPIALNQVSLADTGINPKKLDTTQFEIQYYADSNFFYLTKFFENAVMKVNGREITEYKVEFLLENGMIVELNEYKFQIGIHDITGNIPSLEKYQGQFPIVLRLTLVPPPFTPKDPKFLVLNPINSTPASPIRIMDRYSTGRGTIKLGKGADDRNKNQIILADTNIVPRIPNEFQFRIEFWDGAFRITKTFGEAVIQIKKVGEESYSTLREQTISLERSMQIKLNEYEFEVGMLRIPGPVPSFEEYWRQFPVVLRILREGPQWTPPPEITTKRLGPGTQIKGLLGPGTPRVFNLGPGETQRTFYLGPGTQPPGEIQELTDFDEWVIGEEIEAERAIKRGDLYGYKRRFRKVFDAIIEERAQVKKRIKKSKLAEQNMQEIERLLSELDTNIKTAKKERKFIYLNSAKSNIYDLISLTRDSPIPVGVAILGKKITKGERTVKYAASVPQFPQPDLNESDFKKWKRDQEKARKKELKNKATGKPFSMDQRWAKLAEARDKFR